MKKPFGKDTQGYQWVPARVEVASCMKKPLERYGCPGCIGMLLANDQGTNVIKAHGDSFCEMRYVRTCYYYYYEYPCWGKQTQI